MFSVKTEQATNVEKCKAIEKKMNENMKVLKNGQKDIEDFKKKLQMSYAKVKCCYYFECVNPTLRRLD